MKVQLRRFFRKNVSVFGMLQFEDFSLFTMENFMKIIPTGTYKVTFTYSPKFSKKHPYCEYKGVPLLNNVPGRSGIRIHCGNFFKDVDGCIIVGNGISLEDSMLLSSRIAYRKMMKYLQHPEFKNVNSSPDAIESFDLEIYEDYAINH